MNGKGDRRRPCQVGRAEFVRRWELAFGPAKKRITKPRKKESTKNA
jgi:hypothetical protein